MRSLNVKFEDFYKGFDIHHNIYVDVLSRKYDVSVIVDDASEPDLLFYSFNGSRHYGYDCIKVYCSLENDVPNFNECDYALSAHYLQFGEGNNARRSGSASIELWPSQCSSRL